ncbi:MAG TPA: caspase family protein [Pyrinomonadaceae bacterium]|nr:caspase family protein [Pyrinomonadaceae bacterium]
MKNVRNNRRRLFKTAYFGLSALFVLLFASNHFSQDTRQLTAEKPKVSDKRTALVIGNGGYQTARKLANAVNDATDMAAALKELGFDVISGTDLGRKQMNDKVREFGDALKVNGGVGLFFYAGHGVQVGGRNYLIPVDADIPREDEIEDNAVNLDLVLRKLDSANNGLNIVILDACRNNPFARSWTRGEDTGGLAQIAAPTGTFIAYSTSPGRTASDGEGRNGLYTAQMLRLLRQPDMKIEETFKEIRKAVDAASNGQQIPWDSSSLRGEFYFRGKGAAKVEANVPARVDPGPAPADKMPMADDVLNGYAKAIGSEQGKKISTLVLVGVMENEINGQKINTDIEVYTKQPDKFLRLIKFPTGEITGEVFNGNRGWNAASGKPIQEVSAAEVEANRRSTALGLGDVLELKKLYPLIKVTGKQKLGEKDVIALELKTRDGRVEHMYFNAGTRLLDHWQFIDTTTSPGLEFSTEIDFADWESVNGYRIPMTIHQKAAGISVTIKFNIFQTKFNVPLDDNLFSGK